jgi:hypothetical protein
VDDKPEAMQGYYGPGMSPMPGSDPGAYQFGFPPFFFFFPFIFRIPPRRFIFIPRRRRRRFGVGAESMDCDMCIHSLSEAEWDCMCRLGIPECPVMMDR